MVLKEGISLIANSATIKLPGILSFGAPIRGKRAFRLRQLAK